MSSPKVSLYLRKLQKDLPCGNAFNHLYYVGRSYFRVSRSKYMDMVSLPYLYLRYFKSLFLSYFLNKILKIFFDQKSISIEPV